MRLAVALLVAVSFLCTANALALIASPEYHTWVRELLKPSVSTEEKQVSTNGDSSHEDIKPSQNTGTSTTLKTETPPNKAETSTKPTNDTVKTNKTIALPKNLYARLEGLASTECIGLVPLELDSTLPVGYSCGGIRKRNIRVFAFKAKRDIVLQALTQADTQSVFETRDTKTFFGYTRFYNHTPKDDTVRFLTQTEDAVLIFELPESQYAWIKRALLP